MLQHGAYTLLLDACYDREEFPTEQEAIEWCWANTDEEISAVKLILSRFFKLENGVYFQTRVQEELTAYQAVSQTNKRIALDREEQRRTKRAQSDHEAPPNHKPLTINQKKAFGDKSPVDKSKTKNPTPWRFDDKAIVARAKELKISTVGKNKFQLLQEIDNHGRV